MHFQESLSIPEASVLETWIDIEVSLYPSLVELYYVPSKNMAAVISMSSIYSSILRALFAAYVYADIHFETAHITL